MIGRSRASNGIQRRRCREPSGTSAENCQTPLILHRKAIDLHLAGGVILKTYNQQRSFSFRNHVMEEYHSDDDERHYAKP